MSDVLMFQMNINVQYTVYTMYSQWTLMYNVHKVQLMNINVQCTQCTVF